MSAEIGLAGVLDPADGAVGVEVEDQEALPPRVWAGRMGDPGEDRGGAGGVGQDPDGDRPPHLQGEVGVAVVDQRFGEVGQGVVEVVEVGVVGIDVHVAHEVGGDLVGQSHPHGFEGGELGSFPLGRVVAQHRLVQEPVDGHRTNLVRDRRQLGVQVGDHGVGLPGQPGSDAPGTPDRHHPQGMLGRCLESGPQVREPVPQDQGVADQEPPGVGGDPVGCREHRRRIPRHAGMPGTGTRASSTLDGMVSPAA